MTDPTLSSALPEILHAWRCISSSCVSAATRCRIFRAGSASVSRTRKKGSPREHLHTTRMVPKRADELLDGGSLYWVIRGQVACRQRLRGVRPFVDKNGVGRCRLALDPKVTLV